jgi:antitoxin MazE
MLTKIVSIGNSKGIRIPSAILKQCNIDDQVELIVELDSIVIKPIKRDKRTGWAQAFKDMNNRGEDNMVLDQSVDTEFEDWQW